MGDKMNIRTDLALERAEIAKKSIDGVTIDEEISGEVTVTRMEILNDGASRRLGKPTGKYITLEVPRFTKNAGLDKAAVGCMARELKRVLPRGIRSVLVAGLGNTDITPDSLGPRVANRIIATRHISRELGRQLGLGGLMPVSVLAPGVLGQTGIETGEIILGTVDRISPSAVIVIDALAARSLERLGCTVQMCDTGISPGAGVGNSRMEINEKSLGVPVIAIGVPTVVDIKTMLSDAGGSVSGDIPDMIVTPKEIDMMIDRAAEMIAVSINLCLQKSLSIEDIMGLI